MVLKTQVQQVLGKNVQIKTQNSQQWEFCVIIKLLLNKFKYMEEEKINTNLNEEVSVEKIQTTENIGNESQKEEIKNENNVKLSDPFELFKKTFTFYKENFKKIFGLYFISALIIAPLAVILMVVFVFSAFGPMLVGNYKGLFAGAILAIPAFMALCFLAFWGPLALFNFLKKPEELKEKSAWFVLKDSFKKLPRFFWGSFVFGFLTALGFVLFVIPGLIFYTLFAFGLLVYLEEGKSIKESMKTSREYVRGIEFKVFGYVLFMMALGWIGNFLAREIPFFHIITIFIIVPFTTTYFYFSYKEVKRFKNIP